MMRISNKKWLSLSFTEKQIMLEVERDQNPLKEVRDN